MPLPNRPPISYATARRQPRTPRSRAAIATPSSSLQVSGSVALAPLPPSPAAPRAIAPRPAQPSPVVTFPKGQRRRQPRGLQLLIVAQRSSFICASAITAIALALYGWTVYSQQRWSNHYSRFRQLQHHEQQLVTVTGALEAQILQPSDATSIMRPIAPDDVVELVPAAPRPAVVEPAPSPELTWTAPQPIGY